MPQGASPFEYCQGLLVGPPDLSVLNLPEETITLLNNALVDAGLISFPDLNGNRAKLLRIVQGLPSVDEKQAVSLRFEILGLYQRDYYPELFEG